MLQGIVDYLPALFQGTLGRGQLTGLPYDETCRHGERFEESPVQGAGRRQRHEARQHAAFVSHVRDGVPRARGANAATAGSATAPGGQDTIATLVEEQIK